MMLKRFRLRSCLALIAAIAAIVGSVQIARADSSVSATPPFPYAELAALAAAEAPKSISVLDQVVVRLRPGYGWSSVAQMEAGDIAIAEAATVEYSSWRWNNGWHRGLRSIWLRVALAQGITGWIPAERAALSPGLWARLRTASYDPLLARWVGAGSSELAGLRAWPSGPLVPDQSSIRGKTLGVFGRSVDSGWIALRVPDSDAAVVWAPVGEVELLERIVTSADLPVFVGTETTVLPVGEPRGRQPRSIQPATEWRWTSAQQIIGVGDDTFWRYDPETQAEHSVPRPPGRYELSPDGRRLAIEVEPPADREEQWFNDLALVDLLTGEVTEFVDVHGVHPLDFGSWIGDWSPDSRAFLSPRWARGMEFSVLSATGERYDLPWFRIGRWNPWRWQSDNRLIHEGWEATSIVNRDGSDLETTEHPPLSAAEQYDWWPVAQRLCELPPGEYLAYRIGPVAFGVPDRVVGEEWERIRDCARFESWEVDEDRTILHHEPTGSLMLFQASTGQATELLPRPPDYYGDPRGSTHLSPSGQRAIFHLGHGPVTLGIPYLIELSPVRHTELPLAYDQICGRQWNWSPDETQFTAEVTVNSDHNSEFGSDGLAARTSGPHTRYGVTEIRFLDRTGAWTRSVRALYFNESVIEAKWSHDGRWLAFGGHRTSPCATGH